MAKTGNGPWTVGQTGANYTLTVKNNGTTPTFGTITVRDTLPTGIGIRPANGFSPATGWTCSYSDEAAQATGSITPSTGELITCTSTTVMAVGATNTLSIPVVVTSLAASSVTNYASIGGGGDTFNSGSAPAAGASCTDANHCASTTTSVTALTLPPATCSAGTPVNLLSSAFDNYFYIDGSTSTVNANLISNAGTYKSGTGAGGRFVVDMTWKWNNGAAGNSDGSTLDFVVNGTVFARVTTFSGYQGYANIAALNGASLMNGATSMTVDINRTTTERIWLTLPASVSSISSVSDNFVSGLNAGDDMGNNVQAIYGCSPDLKIAKTHTPSSFIRGAVGTYNLTVSNAGSALTSGAMTVTDTLPTGLTVSNGAVALSGTNAANWTCNAASNVITCTGSTAIAAGSSSTFGFNVNVSLSAASSVTNNVSVSGGGEAAPNTGNNTASDVTATIIQPAFTGCPSDGYVTRGTTGTDILLYSLNYDSGAMSAMGATFLPNLTNAIGFRQQDGYIWGWNNDAAGRRLVRIGADGSAVMPFASAPAGLPAGQQFYIADIQPSTGYYVGDSGTTLYYIDVTTNTVVSTVAHTDTTSTDIAFNPTDGNIYTVTNTTGAVMRINPVSGAVTSVGISLPMDASSRGWGGLFFDNQGTMYAYKGGIDAGNTSGAVYRVFNVDGSGTLAYDLLTTSLAAGNLDGARCSAAPPQGAPALIINKTTTGAAGGPFGFTVNNTMQTSGSVTTATAGTAVQVDGDPTLSGTQPFTVKSALIGQPLTISENTLPAGWNLTGASCSIDGSPVGSLAGTTYTILGSSVSAGSLIECSFTNSNAAPDLKIAKTHTPSSFIRGAIGTYNLTVSNAGNASTSGTMTVTDTLPTGLSIPNGAVTLSGTNSADWSCNAASNVITCTGSTAIAASGTSTFGFNVYTANNAASTVTNNVSVSGGGEPSANNGNNTASDATPTVAQNPFAGCDTTMYLNTATATNSQLYTVNYATNTYTYNPIGSSVNFYYNAMGYRSADNFIYAIGVATPAAINTPAHVLRIGSDGIPVDLGIPVTGGGATISATAYNETNSGAFGPDGYYYVHTTGGVLYKIDVSTAPPTIVSSVSTVLTASGITDLVFHPTNGLIYGILTTGNQLVSINPTTGAVTNIGSTGANATYGSLWMGADGQLYGLRDSGGIYRINLTTGAQTLLAPSPAASNTDGALCLGSTLPISPNVTGYKSVKLTNDVNGDGIAEAGDGLQYTLTYVNTGSAYSTNFQITDTLQAGVTITATGAQTVTAAQGSNSSVMNTVATANSAYNGTSNTNLLASGATLAHGSDRITVTIPVTVNAGFTGTLSNQAIANGDNLTTANIKSDNVDNTTSGLPNGVTVPAGSAAQTQTAALDPTTLSVNGVPNVGLLKSCPLPANCTTAAQIPGTDLTYKIAFANTGTMFASGIKIVDAIPANTDFKIGSAVATVGSSGLTFAIEYSNDYDPLNPSAATWTYTPASAGGGASAGYDRLVKAVRWRVTAGMLSNVSPNNAGDVSFVTKIR